MRPAVSELGGVGGDVGGEEGVKAVKAVDRLYGHQGTSLGGYVLRLNIFVHVRRGEFAAPSSSETRR